MDEIKDMYTEEQLEDIAHDCYSCEDCMDIIEHIKKCLQVTK